MEAPSILFEDSDILIAEKNVGELSEASESTKNLPRRLFYTLGLTALPHPVHRLDREVGGALLLAKNAKAMAACSQLATNGQIDKTYYAVIPFALDKDEDTWQDLLFHDKSRNKTFVVKKVRRGVKDARLSYRTVATTIHDGTSFTLVAVTPHTGRTHQIRVQFASRGFPLYGDRKYGAPKASADSTLGLFCHTLSFPHPKSKKSITVTAPLPDIFPFSLFENLSLM